MRADIHGGWATPTASQHNILTRKNSHFFLVLLTGFEPRVFGSRVEYLPIEPPRTPFIIIIILILILILLIIIT